MEGKSPGTCEPQSGQPATEHLIAARENLKATREYPGLFPSMGNMYILK